MPVQSLISVMDNAFFVSAVIFFLTGDLISSTSCAQESARHALVVASNTGIGLIEGLAEEWLVDNQTVFAKFLNLSDQRSVSHLATHYEKDILLWFVPGQRSSIYYSTGRIRAKNYSSPVLLLDNTCSGQVNGISVDWINNNVYWIDGAYGWIKVAALRDSETFIRVLIDEGINNPTALTIHPQQSYIFWADSDFEVIRRSDLSGGQQTNLVTLFGQEVIALASDAVTDSVIWLSVTDLATSVERIALDGSQRIIIYEGSSLKLYRGPVLVSYNVTVLLKYNSSELVIIGRNNASNISILPRKLYTSMSLFGPEKQQPAAQSPCLVARCKNICVTVSSNTKAVCLCPDGFRLMSDGISCQVDDYLSSAKYVVYMGPGQGSLSFYEVWMPSWNESALQLFIPELNFVTAIATCFNGGFIVVAHSEGYIELIPVPGMPSKNVTRKKYLGIGRVEGIAVDWISSNIYWADSKRGHIMVASHDLTYTAQLHRQVNGPRGIAVDAINRRIFWSESEPSVIMMSSTDGTGRARFVYRDLVSPEKLVVDNHKHRLYWTDSGKGSIEFISLVGNMNREKFVARPASSLLFGIAVFQSYVAWTEKGSSKGIFWKLNSDKNSSSFEAFYSLPNSPGEIALYGKFAEPADNGACSTMNGGCSQICLPQMNSSKDRSCLCSLGYDLALDGTSCLPHSLNHSEDNFLLLVDAFRPAIYQLDIDTEVPSILPLPMDQQPASVAFDLSKQILYWSDVANSVIQRRPFNWNFSEVFLRLPNGSGCYSLAFDNSGGDLLYFTMNTSGVIYAVASTNATNQTTEVIAGLQKPSNVILDSIHRNIYWTEAGRIGKASLDNLAERVYLASIKAVTDINGLAVHPQWNMLFWCSRSFVYVSDLDGNNVTLINLDPLVICGGLVAYDDVLYAVDINNQNVICINWIDHTSYSLENMPYQRLMGINIVPILRNIKQNALGNQNSSESGRNSIIIGSVLGCAVLIFAVVTMLLWRQWRKNERPKLTRLHQLQRPRHPNESSQKISSIHISEDFSHVSYYGKGVYRNSLMDRNHHSAGQKPQYFESWGYQGRDIAEPKKDDTSSLYETSSVISDVSSNSPFVRSDLKKGERKGRDKKPRGSQEKNHSHSDYTNDEYLKEEGSTSTSSNQTSNSISSHQPPNTNALASAFHSQYFFGGRSWGDTLPKKF